MMPRKATTTHTNKIQGKHDHEHHQRRMRTLRTYREERRLPWCIVSLPSPQVYKQHKEKKSIQILLAPIEPKKKTTKNTNKA
jgi:hypothetical protein